MILDDIDRAQEATEQFLTDVLSDHQRHRPTGPSLAECEDCGNEIPIKRREAQPGCTRCITCQHDFEITSRRNP